MSSDEFVSTMRNAMRMEIVSRRRALRKIARDYAGDNFLIVQAESNCKDGIFAVREHQHLIEQMTGYPILSTTRAQMRREGRRVN